MNTKTMNEKRLARVQALSHDLAAIAKPDACWDSIVDAITTLRRATKRVYTMSDNRVESIIVDFTNACQNAASDTRDAHFNRVNAEYIVNALAQIDALVLNEYEK